MGKYYPPFVGGMEKHLGDLCEQLTSRLALSVVVSNVGPRFAREQVNGVDVLRLPNYTRDASVPLSPHLVWLLRNIDADVVHLHSPNPVAELACLISRPRARLVVTYHFDPVRQRSLIPVYRQLFRLFLTRVDLVITTSQAFGDSSPALRGLDVPRGVVPHGIDPEAFVLEPGMRPQVARIRRAHPRGLLLFVGRLSYYKGIDQLVRAMELVPEASLLVVGSGRLQAELQRLSFELGVAQRVTFMGEVPHRRLTVYLQACDMLVLPSVHRAEAFGLVQLEAHACSKPVVSTNLPTGVPWVNQHGITGLVVPPGDVGALAEAIRELLGNPRLRARMGAAARERVVRKFSQQVMAEAVERCYRQVAGE